MKTVNVGITEAHISIAASVVSHFACPLGSMAYSHYFFLFFLLKRTIMIESAFCYCYSKKNK